MLNYPWYQKLEVKDNSIQQGDFIYVCPIVKPPQNLTELNTEDSSVVKIETYNVIIISQSCDIEQNKLEIILVCPFYTFNDLCQNLGYDTDKNRKKVFNEIKSGRKFSLHMLDKYEDFELKDYLIIDFRNIFGVNIDVLKNHISNNHQERIRLAPPYREHLSQAFARFFMRVGLPIDIKNPF